jgi:hypothetical protein
MPTALRNPPPGAPPPFPAAPSVSPPRMLLGRPWALMIGIIVGAAAGGLVCIVGLACILCVAVW